jgi:hypothetical protein
MEVFGQRTHMRFGEENAALSRRPAIDNGIQGKQGSTEHEEVKQRFAIPHIFHVPNV